MIGTRRRGPSFLVLLGLCHFPALFAAAGPHAAEKVVSQEFTAVAAAPGEAPWIGLYRRGFDGERPTYEGRLLRLESVSGDKASQLKSWGQGFDGERVIAILPASLEGKKGILVILEWMVEGPMAPRLAFVAGPKKTDRTDLGYATGCGEIRAIRAGNIPSQLTLDCLAAPSEPEDAALSRRIVSVTFAAPKLAVSLPARITFPQRSARDLKHGELKLVNPAASSVPLEDSFEELSISGNNDKEVRRIAAKTLLMR